MKNKPIFTFILMFLSASFVWGNINGYLSFEYVSGERGGVEPPPTFQNARLGILFSGELAARFGYTAEARIQGTRINIEQALIRFTPSKYFSLCAGMYLVPFGLYNQFSRPHETLLVRLPLHVGEIYPESWRDIGMLVEGSLGIFFYSSYIGNGLAEGEDLKSRQQFVDNNKNKVKGGRAGVFLGKKLAVGVSYHSEKYDQNAERSLTLQGVDVTWEPYRTQFLYEYTKALLENPFPFDSGAATAHFVQLSFMIGIFQPVGSYQYLAYEDPFHGAGFVDSSAPGAGIMQKKIRWTIGIVCFPIPNILIKIEYDFNQDKILGLKSNTFAAQVALSF